VSAVPHPRDALFAGERAFPLLPACDHYAGVERTMRKALRLQAGMEGRFDVTLDLEDGAPTGGEREHAALVVELLNGDLNTCGRAGVRIHDHESPHWRADVTDIVRGAGRVVSHITIPKVLSARALSEMIYTIQTACAHADVRREIPLHVLIETHGAVADVFKIAALPWLRTLEFGIMDFVSSHHGAIGADAMESPGQFEHALVARAKARQVAAALAHGLVPVHNVTLDVRNPGQVRDDALRARHDFGYLRMWSIHPSQIEPVLSAFAPSRMEAEKAARVLLAARAVRWGPVDLDGRLYDRASYRYWWQVLERARLAGQALQPEAEAAFFG